MLPLELLERQIDELHPEKRGRLCLAGETDTAIEVAGGMVRRVTFLRDILESRLSKIRAWEVSGGAMDRDVVREPFGRLGAQSCRADPEAAIRECFETARH